MNKAELIEALAPHFDGNKAEAGRALNAVVETIIFSTARDDRVSITGFGVFEKVRRPARMVRNPRTGERKRAKATAVPRFRAGTELKSYVSGEKKPPRSGAKSAQTPVKTTTKRAAPKAAAAKAPAARTATKTTGTRATATKAATRPVAKKVATAKSAAKKATTKPAAKKTAVRKASAASSRATTATRKAPARRSAKRS